MKLNVALAAFLKVDRSPRSTLQYRHVLTRLLDAIGASRQVARVRLEDLLDYFDELRARGLKAVTLSGYIGVAKSFFAWCEAQHYCDFSPAKALKARQVSTDPSRNRAIPPDELNRMVDYARVTSPRNHALILFLVDTGCRVGGLASLTLDHLDLEQKRAWLLEKGGHWLQVFFGDETADALRAWLIKRPPVAHAYVWTAQGAQGKPLSRVSIAHVIRRLAERTSASRLWGPHSIRHSVGHAYERLGVPPTVTQGKLGHKDVATTMSFYYQHDLGYVEQISQRYPLAALNRVPPAPKLVEVPPRTRSG